MSLAVEGKGFVEDNKEVIAEQCYTYYKINNNLNLSSIKGNLSNCLVKQRKEKE